mgnify:CR=1 FL=1
MKYVLDTHILIWWLFGSDKLPSRYAELLAGIEKTGDQVGLSVISLWEILKLHQSGRITLKTSIDAWIESVEFDPFFRILDIDSRTVLESERLGQGFHKDPADRFISACTRIHGARLLTCDEQIIRSQAVAIA